MTLVRRHSLLGKSLRSAMQASSSVGILFVLLLLMALASYAMGGEMCTKSVPLQRVSRKKVSVLRRVPASCSNWEKAWSWVTKQDCGTKYRLDMVEVPSPKVVTYRLVKVCCEGDLQCQQAQADNMAAKEEAAAAEERFLAIVLGSCAAVLIIVILVVSISLCRKKKRCLRACEERKHVYVTTEEEEEESSELQTHKEYRHPEDRPPQQSKTCESLYAEIHDPGLPRYTDIFREDDPSTADHFQHATAPPIALYESRTRALMSTADKTAQGQTEQDNNVSSCNNDDYDDDGDTVYSLLQKEKPPLHGTRDTESAAQCQHEQDQTPQSLDSACSVTQEDPPVVLVSSSLSPSSDIIALEARKDKHRRDEKVDGVLVHTYQNKACPAQYEALGSRGCRDSHEYQQLAMTVVSDLELTCVAE